MKYSCNTLEFSNMLTHTKVKTHTKIPSPKYTPPSTHWRNTYLHQLCTLTPAMRYKKVMVNMLFLGSELGPQQWSSVANTNNVFTFFHTKARLEINK